ncbi:FxsB family cyclophane-forming radical SAM/SPASM peptide maturase [Micromonospora avicenniae]|uniref:FxsB family cyclophane-forming radical SAM/SPASM peptide maturase n=1 Tax=Micromonospora avicenniae TaxID=1198245 RepID=UPI0034420503
MACRCGAAGPAAPCRPISQYVLKVHSRCDLSCDHCYVYQEADQTWRAKPVRMAPSTVRAAAARIGEHARAHDLPVVHVVLHGGEPLLLGPAGLREVLAELRGALTPDVALDLRMQTNGVLLDEELCRLLAAYEVKVGVSLDGDRAANDRHRKFAHGGSSHPHARRALALLRRPEFRGSYAGILCTIDVRNDPDQVYSALLAEEPPRIDLLLPHATWDRPPWRPPGVATPYADWLGRIHRRWVDDGRPVPIRLFEALTSGAGGGTEAVGLAPADLLVVETDGSWEQVDSLKVAFHGAAGTDLDVFAHPVDEAARHPGVAIRQEGLAGLCATCRACPVVSRCGGGLYPHRWRTGTGFDNPSVYCADLQALIATVDSRPAPDRAGARRPGDGPAPAGDGPAPAGAGGRPPRRPSIPVPRPSERVGERAVDPAADRLLAEIAGGHGGPWALDVLAQTQLSITRVLLETWRDIAGGSAAWELLAELDATAGDAVGAVLAHPFVRPWLVRRLARRGAPDVDLVPALAVVAAVRAGVEAVVEVPARGGALVLPALGRLTVGDERAGEVRTLPGGLHIRVGSVSRVVPLDGAGTKPTGWQPVRRAPVTDAMIMIEDVDPERDCYGQPVAPTLDADAAEALGETLARARLAVHRDVPAHGAALDAGLRAVVPLAPDPLAPWRSATARQAFGAIAVAEMSDADAMAVLLVHEWQHGKLGALLDLYDLVDPASSVRIPVAWRTDPRPVEGALQGAYAHLAVTEVWHARATADRPDAQVARGHLVRYRDWTREAVEALLGSGALTDLGERFVGRMGHVLEEFRADQG